MTATIRQSIDALCAWAARTDVVQRVYIFGSRTRSDFREDSDIDIAVEIKAAPDDSGPHATWVRECEGWKSELQPLFAYRVDLQQLEGDATPKVKASIAQSSIVVYARRDAPPLRGSR